MGECGGASWKKGHHVAGFAAFCAANAAGGGGGGNLALQQSHGAFIHFCLEMLHHIHAALRRELGEELQLLFLAHQLEDFGFCGQVVALQLLVELLLIQRQLLRVDAQQQCVLLHPPLRAVNDLHLPRHVRRNRQHTTRHHLSRMAGDAEDWLFMRRLRTGIPDYPG